MKKKFFRKRLQKSHSTCGVHGKLGVPRIIIQGTLDFHSVVVLWFKSLKLNPQKDIPFVTSFDANPKLWCGYRPSKAICIAVGVFSEKLDEVIHFQVVEADAMDAQLKQVLGNEELVVLS